MSIVRGLVRDAAELFEVRPSEILGDRRLKRICRARFAVVWAARRRGLSSPVIGHMMRRDHSTILDAERRADEIRASDPAFKRATDLLLTTEDPGCPLCGGFMA